MAAAVLRPAQLRRGAVEAAHFSAVKRGRDERAGCPRSSIGSVTLATERTIYCVPMAVPLFDTSTPLDPLRAEIADAITRVVDGGRFILGPEVSAFEEEFAAACGARQAIGVANGTDALTIALRAMGVGPGDDVIVPSYTFYASAEAIPPTGARPVFCDVDPETACVTPETVAAALTPHTKAVIAVHLYGNIAPVAEIEALGVPVLEDAAQAAGSRTTAGRPGVARDGRDVQLLPVQEPRVLRRRRRDHDERPRDRGPVPDAALPRLLRQDHASSTSATTRASTSCRPRSCGCSCRTSTRGPTAGAPRWPTTSAAGLGELVTLPRPTAGAEPAWHLYVIRHAEIERLAEALAARGIGQQGVLPRARPSSAGDDRVGRGRRPLPATEELARNGLAIPMSPVLDGRAGRRGDERAARRARRNHRLDERHPGHPGHDGP